MKSNITDNESAKMKTGHGVIQGYTGVAAADSKHQVVVHAEAFGQGQEHGLLTPMLEGIQDTFQNSDKKSRHELKKVKVTADSGYHNREMLEYLETDQVDAYIADTGFRARDPRFKDHKQAPERNRQKNKERFTQEEFAINIKKRTCRCPAGHEMWLKAKRARIGQYLFMQFLAYEKDCLDCGLRKRCLRSEHQRTPRQVNVALDTPQEYKMSIIERMKRQVRQPEGTPIQPETRNG